MNTEQAIICYFPTTVALIDDKFNYLLGVIAKLNKETAAYRMFSNPKQAYEYLINASRPPQFIDKIMTHEEETERGERNINLNIYSIYEEVYDSRRFDQLSVIVIDQEMPGLKGLEICEKFKNTLIRKILLTGEVDDRQAIDAFNRGIIDHFIPKNATDFYTKLNDSIAAQQKTFMQNVLSPVMNALTHIKTDYHSSCLVDSVFINFLNEIIRKYKICEYYLSDDNGSFIFFDINANPSTLVLKDENEMMADFETAQDSDEPPSAEILRGLENRSLILHTPSQNEWHIKPSEWQKNNMIHPAKILKGGIQNYYYAYIDNLNNGFINRDNILSFRTYQENHDPSE